MLAIDGETADQAMWRALADPTRRSILQILRGGPATSGGLASAFPTSRVAVTQHLNVLRDVGLITTRKKGRERWHHLNAVPLVRALDSFLDPLSNRLASGLVAFKSRLEGHVSEPGIDIAMEVDIGSPPSRVFEALTAEPGAWWGHPYLDPRAERLELSPELGAPFTEHWSHGGQVLAAVTGLEPHRWLRLTGPFHLGLALAHADFELSHRDGGTALRLHFTALGAIDEERAADFRGGWSDLVTRQLKHYAESGVATGIDSQKGAGR